MTTMVKKQFYIRMRDDTRDVIEHTSPDYLMVKVVYLINNTIVKEQIIKKHIQRGR